jgi:hypothetical protein
MAMEMAMEMAIVTKIARAKRQNHNMYIFQYIPISIHTYLNIYIFQYIHISISSYITRNAFGFIVF